MEGKHTKGPWSAVAKKTSVGHAWMIEQPRMCLYVDHRGIGDGSEETKRAEADARLIATAPELLEALQLIVDCDAFIPNLTRQTQDDIEHDAERRDMLLRKAAEAIARATGKA